MKTKLFIPSVLVGLMSIPAAAEPLATIPGSVAPVTFALTLSEKAPNTVRKNQEGKPEKGENGKTIPAFQNFWAVEKKDIFEEYMEYKSKIVTRKYGNKELLTDLLAAGILGENGDSISGWSIQVVQPTQLFSQENGPVAMYSAEYGYPNFYAVKGTTRILITPNILIYVEASVEAVNYLRKSVFKDNVGHVSESLTDVFNWKDAADIEIGFGGNNNVAQQGGLSFELSGIQTGSAKWVPAAKIGTQTLPLYLNGPGKISGICGYGPDVYYEDLEYNSETVVEGAISYGPGKANDVTNYPGVLNVPWD
jgi:hypothetical protein